MRGFRAWQFTPSESSISRVGCSDALPVDSGAASRRNALPRCVWRNARRGASGYAVTHIPPRDRHGDATPYPHTTANGDRSAIAHGDSDATAGQSYAHGDNPTHGDPDDGAGCHRSADRHRQRTDGGWRRRLGG